MRSTTTAVISSPPVILVIDDQEAIGYLIKRIARRTFPNASVLVATSGLAGLDLAERYAEMLTLVILDVHMPVVDGRTVCAGIRGLVPLVPVIPCTFDVAALPVMLELGCVGAIVKPFSLDELIEQLRRASIAPVQPLPAVGWIAAMRDQALALLAFARDTSVAGIEATGTLSNDLVVMPRAVVAKLHAQLDQCYQRIGRSRELRQAITILREALE